MSISGPLDVLHQILAPYTPSPRGSVGFISALVFLIAFVLG